MPLNCEGEAAPHHLVSPFIAGLTGLKGHYLNRGIILEGTATYYPG